VLGGAAVVLGVVAVVEPDEVPRAAVEAHAQGRRFVPDVLEVSLEVAEREAAQVVPRRARKRCEPYCRLRGRPAFVFQS
jgi:hypothetical protein